MTRTRPFPILRAAAASAALLLAAGAPALALAQAGTRQETRPPETTPVPSAGQATPQAPAPSEEDATPHGTDRSIPHLAPRDPGHTGVIHGHQRKATDTVEGIDRRLLREEKTRPALPNQAPSPSQTRPGGTAQGQTPGSGSPPS